jgi:DNA-binding PadR family transcriptional regulator
MNLSLSEQLILGILSEQPRHGYNIEKVILSRGMRKWTDIGFSSIYYILERLETKKFVTSDETKGKKRKQYSITDMGITALRNHTIKLISERMPANTHFMTGLATSHSISNTELTHAFEQRKLEISLDYATLKAKRTTIKNIPQSARQMLELSVSLLNAELLWINKELESMRK